MQEHMKGTLNAKPCYDMSNITQGGTLHELITSGQGTGIDHLSW